MTSVLDLRAVKLTARALADHLCAELEGPDVEFDGASIDSRQIQRGALFVPVVAERDGHDFIGAAVEAGAVCYLDSRASDAESSSGSRLQVASIIRVADTSAVLLQAGRLARDRLTGPVIGVTGSVGKTSTKDLIAGAFGTTRRTHANPASFNNELGLPLTLLNAPDQTEVTVLEMGARGIGHIAALCEIGRPDIGVVTRVALAHGEQFGSIDGVAQAKGELVEALPVGGAAVLNADDPRVLAMAGRTAAQVITFGVGPADVMVRDLVLDDLLRPRFILDTPAGSIEVRLEARGAHLAHNAAAAVATALVGGVALVDAVEGIGTAAVSPWRMEVELAESGALVINDAYNANPTSVRAAVDALLAVSRPRRTAVLGYMAELGADSGRLHRQVAEEVISAGIRLIAVGAPDYGAGAEHVADADGAAELLGPLDERDAVLVKGSRVSALESLAGRLLHSTA